MVMSGWVDLWWLSPRWRSDHFCRRCEETSLCLRRERERDRERDRAPRNSLAGERAVSSRAEIATVEQHPALRGGSEEGPDHASTARL